MDYQGIRSNFLIGRIVHNRDYHTMAAMIGVFLYKQVMRRVMVYDSPLVMSHL